MSLVVPPPLTRAERDGRLADLDWRIRVCEERGDHVTAQAWRRYRERLERSEVSD